MTWMPYNKWVCHLTYHLNQDSAQTSGTTGRCHSSESWVCKCLKLTGNNKSREQSWRLVLIDDFYRRLAEKLSTARLTCCQDELTIPWHFDRGAHCGHLKVLDELDPALDVWGVVNRKVRIMTYISEINQTVCDAENSPTSFFCNCLFFRSDSHCIKEVEVIRIWHKDNQWSSLVTAILSNLIAVFHNIRFRPSGGLFDFNITGAAEMRGA